MKRGITNMRKTLMFVLVFLFIGTFSFAGPFAPPILELSAPAQQQYDFDGSLLELEVIVTGTPANVIFLVFTNGKGGTISDIRNGYMGWHYVNNIDTCIFVSSDFLLGTGVNTITWTGIDADGNLVPQVDGDYAYYLYGFDNVTAKQLAAPISCGWENASMWREFDTDGIAMQNPEFYPSIGRYNVDVLTPITRQKWIMGEDVSNALAIETCTFDAYNIHSPYVPDPNSMTGFFSLSIDASPVAHVRKYTWTPGGDGILDTSWGDAGEVTYATPTSPTSEWTQYAGAIDIGSNLIMASATDISGVATESTLKLISVSGGYVIDSIDLTDWWIRVFDGDHGGQMSSGPNDFDYRNGMLVMGSHSTCMNMMIDPHAEYLDDELSWNKWVNQNGDYVGDHNFEPTATNLWICHDYNVAPYKYNTDTDALNFVCFPSFDCGAVTYGLYAPDGTGLGYYAAAGEYAEGKWMAKFVDCESAYDGLYTDGANVGNAQLYFIAQDSFKGMLVYKVSVEEDAPAQFVVSQNSPNPFNPTTTISFEIADPGNVTIDVYNVAGQKVDTIVNEYMEDGTHSRVWDATGFSAGVYFYTVKSGNLSKTMSMMLLK